MHLDPRFKRSNILRGRLSAATRLASNSPRLALIAALSLIASASGGAQSAFADRGPITTAQILDDKGNSASPKVGARCTDCCCKDTEIKGGLRLTLAANWSAIPFKGLELKAVASDALCEAKNIVVEAVLERGPQDSQATLLTGVLVQGITGAYSGDLVAKDGATGKGSFPYLVRVEGVQIAPKC